MTIDSSYTYFGYDIRLQNKISRAYDSLFSMLSEMLKQNPPQAINESTTDGKIIAIGDYRAKHPELFTEIAGKYIYGVSNPGHVAPASPKLEAAHTTAPYRLVWEYFLLKPPAAGMFDQYDIRVGDAIAKINNPSSLLTIQKQYESSTKTKIGLDQSVVLKQRLSLLTIGKMPSEAATRILLTMINLPIQKDSTGKIKWQPKDFAKDMLSGKEHLKTETQWKTAAKSLEKKQIDAATRRGLRDLKLID